MTLVTSKGTRAHPTNELRHRVVFTLSLNGACDAVVLQDREEKLHEVRGVRRSDDIQHLCGEDSRSLLRHAHEQRLATG